jgi:hypothetical protein
MNQYGGLFHEFEQLTLVSLIARCDPSGKADNFSSCAQHDGSGSIYPFLCATRRDDIVVSRKSRFETIPMLVSCNFETRPSLKRMAESICYTLSRVQMGSASRNCPVGSAFSEYGSCD